MQIEVVNKHVIQSFIVDPIYIAMCIETYVNNLKRESIELNDSLNEFKNS